MTTPINVVLVPDRRNSETLGEMLGAAPHGPFALQRARTWDEAQGLLAATTVDVLLADLRNGGRDLLPDLARFQRRPAVPVVLVVESSEQLSEAELQACKAEDVVTREALSAELLGRALRAVVESSRNRRALFESNERFVLLATALSAADNSVVITDRTGSILWANPAFFRLTGYSEREVISQNPRLLKSGRQDAAFYQKFWETITSGQTWRGEFVNRRKDGGLYIAEGTVTPVRANGKEITNFIGVMQDVTEQRKSLDRLRHSEQRARFLFEAAPDAYYMCDQNGVFMDGNRAAEEMIGCAKAELIGKSFLGAGLLTPADLERARSGLQRNAEGLSTGPEEFTLLRRDGGKVVAEIRTHPVRIDGQMLVLGMARDVTERKRAEEELRRIQDELRQVQKMEAIGHLAGGVAHDFNNLLVVMRGHAELLLMEGEQFPEDARDSLLQISAAAERAANLTRQLLAFSRKQVMEPKVFALNEVVENLVKMLKRIIGEHIQLECAYAPGPLFLHADAGMLEQVIVNLVVNARDAMPKGGSLRVSTEVVRVEENAHWGPEARPGLFACLMVADNGVGIAPEHLPRLFEPFFTTKEPGKGTGLGLSTVYGIVKQHQGWVQVNSEPGAGAVFRVFLPALSHPAVPGSGSTSKPALPRGTETILLVEDDEAVRNITRRVLEAHGYKVLEAVSAAKALDIWQSHHARVDLLLTDMVMPDGMSGRDLEKKLRTEKPELKVLFASGYTAELTGRDTEFVRRAKGFFLQKPCSPQTLLETVRRCLEAG